MMRVPELCRSCPDVTQCREREDRAEIIRRCAARGLKAAQKQGNSEFIDVCQHILDELGG